MGVKLRWKTYKNGKKSAYLDIFHDGERHYEFLGLHQLKGNPDNKQKKELAESIRAKRELEIIHSEHGFTPKHKADTDFIAYYQKFLSNYKGKDVRLVRYSLVKFKLFIDKNKIAGRLINHQLCKDFADYLKDPENGLKGETPYNYWLKFKRVVKQAIKDKVVKGEPLEGIRIKRNIGQLKKEVLTAEELSLIAKAPCGNDEVKRAFLFCCFTGLGRAEILKLTWRRIDNNKIRLFREKSGEQVINDLPDTALSILGERGKADELIFNLPSDVAVGKLLKNWMKNAGIEKHISFYCARHTFATLLLKNNVNLKVVADLMGQTSTKHTMKYLNYVDELKSQAMQSLPTINLGE